MKKFRSLNYLAGVCLVLLLIASTLVIACSSQATSTSTSTAVTSTSTSKPVTSTTTTIVATSTTTKPATSTSTTVPVSILGCPQGSPTPGLVPQFGGTLKMIYNNSPANLGAPWKAMSAWEKMLTRFAIEGLVGLDTKGEPIPQLATSWDSDPDKKTITFTLRQGVKFHDGTDFNAAAAKWCLDMYRSGTLADLKLVTSVNVIDDYHIRLNLSGWDPLFIQSLNSAGPGKMTSPTAAQKLGDDIMRNPVGTGPFKFVSFVSQTSLKYTRFDGYWQKGLPYLDAVEINFVADPVVSLTSFNKGEAHYITNLSATDAKKLKTQGITIYLNSSAIACISGDSKNKSSPFADIKVRQAIAYAIDNTPIVNAIYEGFNPPTTQLATPGMTAYDATIKGYPYNPAKAQELLATAGYSTANPLTQKLTYTTNAQSTDLYTAIQGYLKKVGINITLEPVDSATFNKIMAAGWNNQLMEYRLSYNGIELKYSTSLTQSLCATQYRYVSVWTPDDYNTLYKLMMAENDPAKREAYYQTLNKMAVDDYCLVVPLMGLKGCTANSPNLHDLGVTNNANAEFLPERAWLSK